MPRLLDPSFRRYLVFSVCKELNTLRTNQHAAYLDNITWRRKSKRHTSVCVLWVYSTYLAHWCLLQHNNSLIDERGPLPCSLCFSRSVLLSRCLQNPFDPLFIVILRSSHSTYTMVPSDSSSTTEQVRAGPLCFLLFLLLFFHFILSPPLGSQ